MTQPAELGYPVICFGRDDSISVVDSAGELRRCNAVAWFRNHYFDDLRVVDSAGTPYRVRSARLATPLVGWRRLLAKAANQTLVVDLDLDRLGDASLAEAKQTAIEWLGRSPEFWEAAFSLPEWEQMVSQAQTMEALCNVFSTQVDAER